MPRLKIISKSQKFLDLQKNIQTIEKHLMPKIKISGSYTDREKNLIRGYRLLVHAEIEYYFEAIAKEIVLSSQQKWVKTRKPSHILTALFAFTSNKNPDIPETYDDKQHIFLEDRITNSVSTFMGYLNQNHGIKQKNLLKILLPLGISITDIDPTWLMDMDTFGDDRGDVAHKSIKVQNSIDPYSEKKRVERFLSEIQK